MKKCEITFDYEYEHTSSSLIQGVCQGAQEPATGCAGLSFRCSEFPFTAALRPSVPCSVFCSPFDLYDKQKAEEEILLCVAFFVVAFQNVWFTVLMWEQFDHKMYNYNMVGSKCMGTNVLWQKLFRLLIQYIATFIWSAVYVGRNFTYRKLLTKLLLGKLLHQEAQRNCISLPRKKFLRSDDMKRGTVDQTRSYGTYVIHFRTWKWIVGASLEWKNELILSVETIGKYYTKSLLFTTDGIPHIIFKNVPLPSIDLCRWF